MLVAVPLPTATDAPWPPPAAVTLLRDTAEASAWYSGDPAGLSQLYAPTSAQRRPGSRLWERGAPTDGQPDTRVHVPLAADIAQTGADLLFSEDATWEIPAAHGEKPDAGAKAVEEHLVELSADVNLGATLLEAAELAGGLGGVYLLPGWDPSVSDRPMLSAMAPDRAIPEWRYGHLVAVTFWRELAAQRTTEGRVVWRHLERHEPGLVAHGLYVGSDRHLGARQPLAKHPETAPLAAELDLRQMIGWDRLLPTYVPNVRPNRRHRGVPVGRSDTAGCEGLMDSLDETMTSWVRDIRIGKARIVVPDEFLDRRGRGQGASFDVDREVFSPLGIDPSHADKAGITPVEFKIRTDDHAKTAMALTEQVIRTAGYSPQTFGMGAGGGEVTATEVRAREGASLRTTGRKQRYWSPALAHAGEALLAIDRGVFSAQVEPMRPRVRFGEVVGDDSMAIAETVNMLNLARAASIETRVRMAQPDLEATEVAAEVERIKAEEGIVDDPTGGLV